MTFATNMWEITGLDIPRAICTLIIHIALALFVREFSYSYDLTKNEGRYFFFSNIGWLIGPLLAGFLSTYYGNEIIFIIASIAYSLALLLFTHQVFIKKHPHIKHNLLKTEKHQIRNTIKLYFSTIELIKAFLVNFGLIFWFHSRSIYIPLQMAVLGYTQEVIGIVLSLCVLPLILFEVFIAGTLNNKKVKKYIVTGYIIITIFAGACFKFYNIPNILITLFIIANIGAAFIEPLAVVYFFKITPDKDEKRLYGIFNAAKPLGALITPVVCGIYIYFFSINTVWLFISIVLFLITLGTLSINKKY